MRKKQTIVHICPDAGRLRGVGRGLACRLARDPRMARRAVNKAPGQGLRCADQ